MSDINVIRSSRFGTGRPTVAGASWITIATGRIRKSIGRFLNGLKIPGQIRDILIQDDLTGQEIDIAVGIFFTRISVNGRDYYFRRLTGKFDGTGMGCG